MLADTLAEENAPDCIDRNNNNKYKMTPHLKTSNGVQ